MTYMCDCGGICYNVKGVGDPAWCNKCGEQLNPLCLLHKTTTDRAGLWFITGVAVGWVSAVITVLMAASWY